MVSKLANTAGNGSHTFGSVIAKQSASPGHVQLREARCFSLAFQGLRESRVIDLQARLAARPRAQAAWQRRTAFPLDRRQPAMTLWLSPDGCRGVRDVSCLELNTALALIGGRLVSDALASRRHDIAVKCAGNPAALADLSRERVANVKSEADASLAARR